MERPKILCISVYRGPGEKLAVEQRGSRLVYINGDVEPIVREVDFLLAEAAALRALGPRIQIRYQLRKNGIEIMSVSLVYRARAYHLRLSARARVLVDYLAKRRLPLSAAQIRTGVGSGQFYKYILDGGEGRREVRRFNHVRVHIKRIRDAFADVFREAEMDADPYRVLISEPANGRTVLYLLRCSTEWIEEDRSPEMFTLRRS